MKTFVEQCEKWLDSYSMTHGESTVISFRATIKHLNKFNPKLRLEDWNVEMQNRFVRYFFDGGYAKNFISKQASNLRRLLSDLGYSGKFIRVGNEEVYNTYLTMDEIKQLHSTQLEGIKAKVRDLFLIGCLTGLRFSDISALNNHNLTMDYVIIDTQKTDKRVKIPIHPILREILANPIPKVSLQTLNLTIKEVCKDCGINSEVLQSRTEGNKKIRRSLPKYALVSSHTARRSMITNMYKAGIPPVSIMAISGHKNIRQLMSYIKITDEEISENLSTHPFFKAN